MSARFASVLRSSASRMSESAASAGTAAITAASTRAVSGGRSLRSAPATAVIARLCLLLVVRWRFLP